MVEKRIDSGDWLINISYIKQTDTRKKYLRS